MIPDLDMLTDIRLGFRVPVPGCYGPLYRAFWLAGRKAGEERRGWLALRSFRGRALRAYRLGYASARTGLALTFEVRSRKHNPLLRRTMQPLKIRAGMKGAAVKIRQGEITRQRVLAVLSAAPASLSLMDIARAVGLTDSAVHHHLASLKHRGLAWSRRMGRTAFYGLKDLHPEPIP